MSWFLLLVSTFGPFLKQKTADICKPTHQDNAIKMRQHFLIVTTFAFSFPLQNNNNNNNNNNDD